MPKKADFSTFFSTYLTQEVPESDNPNVRLDCPLVDCKNPTQHFYANTDDGTWHCKHCDKSGNARTLITMIHEQYLHTTTQSQYLSLSEVRGLSPQTLEDAGFAYDYKEDRWLVPYYTFNVETGEWSEFLNNLGYFYPSSPNEKGRYTIKKGGTLPLYLYNPGLHQYPPSDTAVICEGEWDTLAYLEAHPDTEDMFLGKPGAGFNVNFMKTLARTKKVKLYLDNDEAGLRQTASAINVIKNEISDINILDWTLIPNAPKDVRDLWMICGTDTASILDDAMVRYDIEHPPEKDITGIYQTSLLDYLHVEDFSTYIEKTASFLYLTDESIMSMAAVLGITSSILIPGEPLWAFLIGPPSSGKTTFIDSFGGNNELFDNLSKLSAKSLVSGWKDETGDEPSYLAKLKDKTLFVKDFTVTLTDTADSQREVFGLLTDIYDGTVKIPYGNNQIREFRNLYFNMVAGVTDIVHKHSAASIGERFLRIDYLGKNYESREFGRRALQNFGKSKSQKEVMTANTLGFVNYLRSMPPIMEIEDEYMDPILDLAEFIATIRTKVDSDKEGAQYKPRAELPSRLAVQLGKQFVSTRGVYNVDPNKDEYTAAASAASFEVVKKVAIDTCYGFPLDIVNTIIKNPTASRDVIAKKANIHASKAYRILEELIETDVLTKTNGRVGYQGGRPANYYDVNPKLKAVLHYESKETPKRPRPKRPISRP